ncbi:MAG: addiction module protein [Thermoleophilia bacterium]
MRTAAFNWLSEQVGLHGDVLPWELLAQGFELDSVRVPLLGPQGIFKPKVLTDVPLLLTTSPDGPYDDAFGEDDGLLHYRYRGNDPDHRDNRGMREALRAGSVAAGDGTSASMGARPSGVRHPRYNQLAGGVSDSRAGAMKVEELMRAALTLDAASRASMAHELLNSLESLSGAEADQLWVEEAQRRSAEIDAGTAQTSSAEESLARARARR